MGRPQTVQIGRHRFPVPRVCPDAAAVRLEALHRSMAAGSDVVDGEQIAADVVALVLGPRAVLALLVRPPWHWRPALLAALADIVAAYDATRPVGGDPSWLSP